MRWPKRIIEWLLLDVVVPLLCVCFLLGIVAEIMLSFAMRVVSNR